MTDQRCLDRKCLFEWVSTKKYFCVVLTPTPTFERFYDRRVVEVNHFLIGSQSGIFRFVNGVSQKKPIEIKIAREASTCWDDCEDELSWLRKTRDLWHICECVCVCKCVCACKCVWGHVHKCVSMGVCMCASVCVHVRKCVSKCASVCGHVRKCVSMCVCMCASVGESVSTFSPITLMASS